ncbi:endo-1,4-beta-xylanase [Alkalicoccobacillus gibsonii]|uniref:endo-1,4-beta-xylanase n=1 Tax=Alkalicoccobacillus gibsonii TaxID=79881 RepID=UPI003F7C4253
MKQNRLLISVILGLLVAGGVWWMIQQENETIRSLAEDHSLLFGTAIRYQPFSEDPEYLSLIKNEYNDVTIENELKMEIMMPEEGVYDFKQADEMIQFATENELSIRGHTLVWERVPWWLENGDYSNEEITSLLKQYVQTTVERYKGKLYAWDVVNEAFDADGNLKDNFWLRHIGPDYIALAFKWAREADPDVLLFYNDYENDVWSPKTDATLTHLTSLRERGVPIDGIGLQMHLDLANDFDPEELQDVMNMIGQAGFLVHITELDIKLQHSGEDVETKRQKQADRYADIMGVCLENVKCNTYTIWGAADPYSWIRFTDEASADQADPLLFDHELKRKPAYQSIKEVMK